ncbi:unnamed protein product [Adineta steineri]|uniref:Uncharacterized protein n=1 Tax=Adineta steineri TaxID=433720 RepID=A0A815PUG9_9BILA|nr:unnamed protein product [Adineta steineri]
MSGKNNSIFKYGNYVQDFYYNKFNHHREALSKQLEELKINHDSLQPPPPQQLLIEKMNDWNIYEDIFNKNSSNLKL